MESDWNSRTSESRSDSCGFTIRTLNSDPSVRPSVFLIISRFCHSVTRHQDFLLLCCWPGWLTGYGSGSSLATWKTTVPHLSSQSREQPVDLTGRSLWVQEVQEGQHVKKKQIHLMFTDTETGRVHTGEPTETETEPVHQLRGVDHNLRLRFVFICLMFKLLLLILEASVWQRNPWSVSGRVCLSLCLCLCVCVSFSVFVKSDLFPVKLWNFHTEQRFCLTMVWLPGSGPVVKTSSGLM